MSFLSFIYIYLFGGLTFLPLLLVCFIFLHPKDPKITQNEPNEDEEPIQKLSAGEIEEDSQSGILAYRSGWITVTQEYLESPDEITSQTQSINENSAYSTLYKLVQKNNSETTETTEPISPQTSQDKIKSQNLNLKKHRYYAILKHGNLFLYKNQTLKDVKHVIVLSNQFVTLWPRDLADGQLFTKRTAICLIKKDWSRARRLSENFGTSEKLTIEDIINPLNKLSPPKGSFFIYCDTNIEKEDWYFTLIKGSKSDSDLGPLSSQLYAKTLHFQTGEMMDLIQTLYSSEGQLQTKWFNGILGRLFLSLKRTDILRNFLETRITKKLNKIKTPGFLDKFKLGNLDPGDSIPFFTYPNLKEINSNGTLLVSAYVHYHGNLSCNISTKVNLNFGTTRFKQTQVDVVLKVTVQKVEGPVIFKIKPPPSDRVWYSFEIEPIINLKIEPIISSRPITYNIITSTIEKRFKDAIRESLVVPHFDDVVFFNTENELYRAGVWDKNEGTESESDVASDRESVFVDEKSPRSSPPKLDVESKSVNSEASGPSFDKLKLSSTLSDLSLKIKKSKSTHTVGVSGSNFLSDGSMIDSRQGTLNKNLNKTLKKIGDWYSSKDDKEKKEKEKERVEMYSNRRRPRVSSIEKAAEPSYSPVDMFAKNGPLHSRSNSRFSASSDYSPSQDQTADGAQFDASSFERHSASSPGPYPGAKKDNESLLGEELKLNEPLYVFEPASDTPQDSSEVQTQKSDLDEKGLGIYGDEINELIQLDQTENHEEHHKLHRKSPPPL